MSVPTMSRTTRRALRTELLRGVAPVAAVVTLLAGTALMYSDANSWAGQWMPLAASVRFSMLILAPVAVALGAWQGGRERRRRIGEQLATTPRPGWQPLVTAWASVTLGCWLALAIVVGAGAALVAPVASYAGGGWWWILAVAFLALAAMAAVGVALGRAVPSRLTAPVLAIVLYAAQVYAHDAVGRLGGKEWLVPIMPVHDASGAMLPGSVSLQQTLWFAGLAASALVLVGSRQRWLALMPAALAVVGAAPFLTTPATAVTQDEWWLQNTHWEPDPEASELVCTRDEPEVCLARYEAFLLDDVTPIARDTLARLEGIPGAPTRAVGSTLGVDVADESYVFVDTGRVTITGDLHPERSWSVVRWRPELHCEAETADEEHGYGYDWLAAAVGMWATDSGGARADDRTREALDSLRSMPESEQKEWAGELITAGETCDTDALDELAEAVSG